MLPRLIHFQVCKQCTHSMYANTDLNGLLFHNMSLNNLSYFASEIKKSSVYTLHIISSVLLTKPAALYSSFQVADWLQAVTGTSFLSP